MTDAHVVETVVLVLDYVIKIVAIGVVPENRRPSSSTAWLLLILLLPVVGLPLFLLLGSPYVNRRRHRIQAQANARLDDGLAHLPSVPEGVLLPEGLASVVELNRHLTSLPCVTGTNAGVVVDYEDSIRAMAAAVDEASEYVHVEIYITAWDETTDVFFEALRRAAARGVVVRLLLDHLGSRKYPGFRRLRRRVEDMGVHCRLMMPIDPLRGRWRRVDLRNHRKLVVVDGQVGFIGSQNMIAPTYGSRRNARIGRRWNDIMMRVEGQIVSSLEAVFAVDWYTESDELLDADRFMRSWPRQQVGGPVNAMQVVPSGPGFSTEPNLRLFTSLIHRAQHRLLVVSPYFVPDESILNAITTAAYRGVDVELFVSERADQLLVHHAQSSYYRALLDAGVRIQRLAAPQVLHAKFFTVDDVAAVLGSSNMDMRSFGLNYEVSLLATRGDVVSSLEAVADGYRRRCTELTSQEWARRPWYLRYVDNVMRLTSALQ